MECFRHYIEKGQFFFMGQREAKHVATADSYERSGMRGPKPIQDVAGSFVFYPGCDQLWIAMMVGMAAL